MCIHTYIHTYILYFKQLKKLQNSGVSTGRNGSKEPRSIHNTEFSLLCRWAEFQAMVANKRKAVDSALGLHNYGLECQETRNWILEKIRVVDSIQDLGDDLASVMSIQRKLYGIERDLGAIETKLINLQEEAKQLANDNPDHVQDIYDRLIGINNVWQDLQKALQNQEDSLGESSKLQKFLVDLFDFETWLYRAQQSTASEDTPTSLAEAEQLYHDHLALKDDMERHQPDFHDIVDTGNKVTSGQTDPQYQQLEQRVRDLEVGWKDLDKMWNNREHFLSQCLEFQRFLKDVKQSEAIISNQVFFLLKKCVKTISQIYYKT